MTDLFDALEVCLQDLESGADLETVLARFPEHADELRPIVTAAAQARSVSVSEPSPETIRRGRARVLQHAAELREESVRSRRRSIPILQRLTLAFSLAAFLLMLSGFGLLNASASSLPGDSLYTVKRGWENVRLTFVLDPSERSLLETQFYYERLSEVTQLLSLGKQSPVEFAGMYIQSGDLIYVSGVQVVVHADTLLPANGLENGMAVLVNGNTNSSGWVDAVSIEILPQTAVVPEGEAVPVIVTPTQTPQKGIDSVDSPLVGNENEGTTANENQNGNVNSNENANGNSNSNTNSNDNDNNDEDNSNAGDSNNNDDGGDDDEDSDDDNDND